MTDPEILKYIQRLNNMPRDRIRSVFGVDDVEAWQIQQSARMSVMYWNDPKSGWDISRKGDQELLEYIKKLGYGTKASVPTPSSAPKSIGKGFVLHKKGSLPQNTPIGFRHLPSPGNADMYAGQFRFTNPNQYHGDRYSGKWAGLSDIVKEATTNQVVGWGDIADIDDATGQPVGGAASYIDTSSPETEDVSLRDSGFSGVPNEIPTKTIGTDPLGVAKPYNPWAKSVKRRVPVIRRKAAKTAPATGIGVTNKATELAFLSFLEKQGESLSIQNANTSKLADAASQISFSNRFRLASHLSRFKTIQARKDYLQSAGFDPDAAYGRQLLHMAEVEAQNRTGRATQPIPPNITERDTYTKGQDWSIPSAYQAGIPIGGGRLGSFNRAQSRPSSVGYNWDLPGMSITPASMLADNPSLSATRESIWEKLYKHLDDFGDALQGVGTILSAVGGAWATVAGEYDKQGKRITTAASGLIPAPFRNAFVRTASGIRELWSSDQALMSGRLSAAGSMVGGLAGIAGGIFTGNPAAVVGGISGITGGAASWWQAGIKSKGLDITGRLNLWNGALEAILAPFRILGPMIHRVIAALKSLSLRILDVTAKFTQLGLPLTSLTGVTYGNMRTGYGADYMIGANRGTSNSAIESFAGAQMDLYTFGKMDENRLIASALLGAFSDVYSYGGDTQAQYANTVNKVYGQLGRGAQSDQRVMNLAKYIDPTVATRVQQMRNLSVLDSRFGDYNYVQSGQWMADRGISFHKTSDRQRARYTLAGMEANSLLENISESWNMLIVHVWEKLGKRVAISINNILGEFAETGNWRAIVPKVKNAIKTLWTDALNLFGIEGNIGDWFGNVLKTLTPYIQNWAIDIGSWILNKEADLLDRMAVPLDRFITSLSFLRVKPVMGKDGLSFDITNPVTDWQRTDLSKVQTVKDVARSIRGDTNALYNVPDSIKNNPKVRKYYHGNIDQLPLNTLLNLVSNESELNALLEANPSLGSVEDAKKWAMIDSMEDPRQKEQLKRLLFNEAWDKNIGVAYGAITGFANTRRAEVEALQAAKVPVAEIKITNGKESGSVTAHSDGGFTFSGDIFSHTNIVGAVAGVLDNLTGGISQ